MTKFSEELRKYGVKSIVNKKRESPLWNGPEKDGITFSLLSRFLTCRERFRLLVIEGLRAHQTFDHKIEYGHMWHACEEALAAKGSWKPALANYCRRAVQTYPTDAERIDHWYNVCLLQFPIYVKYWEAHKDVTNRIPIAQERVFDVPYVLPSGRVVRLRGKQDSVDYIVESRTRGKVYLQENKTKGDIDESKLRRQLTFDLQTGMYLTAIAFDKTFPVNKTYGKKIGGIRYNVVKRPLSGGKGTIKRKEPSKANPYGESKDAYYRRVAEYIENEPHEYFMRWRVEISEADLHKFRSECLDPILEQLCEWWDWVSRYSNPFGTKGDKYPNRTNSIHWRHPFGVHNVLDEGGSTDLDNYLATGSELGLTRVETLFNELEVNPVTST